MVLRCGGFGSSLLSKKLNTIDGIIPPYKAENRAHVYHLCVIRVIKSKFGLSRGELFTKLSNKGIGLSVHYTPLHHLTFYRKTLRCNAEDFPNAEHVYKEVLSLPLFPTITREQMDYVVEEIERAVVP